MSRSAAASDDLLEQLVHQFSDPHAFWRELIQNSIDAGSTRVEVTLRHTPAAPGASKGLATAQVADWGEGMNRAIIEKFLLTKFRSSKEDDLTKIGKFGIGFMSVFAPRPELVVVDTSRDGEDWRLVFKADRSYDLFRCPEPIEGTRVALHKEMDGAEYAGIATAAREAVQRWCRHSEVELTFAAGGADGSAPPPPAPVREPFRVLAPFMVEHREEGTHIVAGPAPSSPAFCGFYNRGLTLLEVNEDMVPGVTFKIASRWLEHTLTRDNVRRDKSFGKAMALVRRLAEGPLRERLKHELKDAAHEPDHPGYAVLLRHAASTLSLGDLWFRLATGGAVDGKALKKAAGRFGFVTCTFQRDALADALAEQGVPVLWAGDVVKTAARLLDLPQRYADDAFSLALPADGEAERRLSQAARAVLAPAGLRYSRVAVAQVLGSDSHRIAALYTEPGKPERAGKTFPSPFSRGGKKVLCLNSAHPQVAAALKLAADSPRVAALLCVRQLALEWGELGAAADARMTEAALADPDPGQREEDADGR